MNQPHPTLLRDLWEQFQRDHEGCSADTMLCDPELRGAFLAAWKLRFGEASEKDILRGLLRARKQKSGGLRKKGGESERADG